MKILLIGPQGSGKSTQGKLLAEYLKIPVISTGDIFRILREQDNEEGRRIRQILDTGQLVDDSETAGLVRERVGEADCRNGFILDGYPRNLEQIRLFDPLFDKVIYLKLSDGEALGRLLARGREDDTAELIKERLRIYHQQTDPILDYYQKNGLVVEVDGSGMIDEIQEKLRKVVSGQK